MNDRLKPDASEFRRAPTLAAFGYIIDLCDADVRRSWVQAIVRLRGREAFPGDGDSFVHNPLEVLGLHAGIEFLGDEGASDRHWLRALMHRGLDEGKFRTPLSRYAAKLILSDEREDVSAGFDLDEIEPSRLLVACAMTLAFAPSWEVGIKPLEAAVLRHILLERIDIIDASEAAAATVLVQRLVDRLTLSLQDSGSALERIVGLCRRFPLFVNQLQRRQHDRTALAVKDEYDVQDLMHAILKLHFDDVRPEEPAPSFGGKASRIDFFLPSERIIIEAKMTRPTLKQDKVVTQLVDDIARYSKKETVDTLICLVYDPDGHCTMPAAIETDLERSATRLGVRVVVCPQRY